MSLPLPAAEAVALALPSMASSQLSHRPPFLKDAFYWPLTQNLSSVTLDLKGYYRELFSELDIPCPQGIYHSTVKRQAEYLASRWLAREIFSHYGIEDFILSNGSDRAPQWPDGYSGSLSHSDGQIFLITDPRGRLCGNDVEQWISPSVATEITPLLVSPREQQYLAELPAAPCQLTTLVFTLKESLYKALWPSVGGELDFLQAEVVDINLQQGNAILQLTETLDQHWQAGDSHYFRFTFCAERVFSWWLPPTG